MLELIYPTQHAQSRQLDNITAALRLVDMRRRLFERRGRSVSASTDTSQETQDEQDFNSTVSVDLPVTNNNLQNRAQLPLPLMRRDVSDNTNNPNQISDTTDAYDSESDDENDPYFGSVNAREDATQRRRQAAIQAMASTFRCMSLDCMPEPDEMGVPTLIRQPAFSTIETVQLRCICCGHLDEVEIYY